MNLVSPCSLSRHSKNKFKYCFARFYEEKVFFCLLSQKRLKKKKKRKRKTLSRIQQRLKLRRDKRRISGFGFFKFGKIKSFNNPHKDGLLMSG